ncbi:tRNA 1-methyladenosine methyltransferase subunit GCD10 [Kluyveromyces lactis]|uniref:tRNA (adenine(58)-N(1))-methyltransferase non-catalytic subunit TRM6 n=1 Tax=Kluyveromyces lactis (strain ATCC 8585 / CBS 2359 / DSM 70799 / NBRC 1267 / NRRL Y-1140 / WM37) TaxID=284590 RepID=TRM6_KLULA|nr:uncharacterized protein KLLA0_F03377g [Kluyveromyces lactis]Q6CLF6.1 RecName: Full=tRNA (adenine(58)-N(1))-methyltransferase non-catalytic subunit TRM6; AltName: Full=tRNA(m1A58)-methyltransferase subunit TRM6; Short=tRNA(m1A58)MTase subunit TRM6 [Kluyveromyces lactis NRRL Y-1140]CAG97941.1 KLLA0F03377p [Kluyveromyces lactis]|eukprot:XP_455233.1 uncharacterized protein KLLA0_F03377g [Kluyveromyces lactis]
MTKHSGIDPLTQISPNQHVLIRLPSDNLKIVELKANAIVSLGKFGAFRVNEIIGYRFGTTFDIVYDGVEEEFVKGTQTMIGKISVLENRLKASSPALENSSENNRGLINLGSVVQEMSMAEIEAMKREAASGDAIISKMIESHKSFHQKTVHSQEKYLKRKKQKFAKFFTVEYLDSSGLLHYLIEKGDVLRVMDISQESLGMALNLANINSNGQYLCIDETGGLIVYAMLERMFAGDSNSKANGKIVVVHENEHPNLDLLKFSSYSDNFIQRHVKTISVLDFFEPAKEADIKSLFKPLSAEEINDLKSNKKSAYFRRLKWYHNQLSNIEVAASSFDGLLVASTLYLPTLIPRLGEKIHGSRPIVCYSQYKEPLLELSHSLYENLNYLAPSLLETRCRPYQTVRGKLHPLMTMKGGGGYLMWCHRVLPAAEPKLHQETLEKSEIKNSDEEGDEDAHKLDQEKQVIKRRKPNEDNEKL